MPYTFHSEQWLPFSPPLVFAFFSNPHNLPRLQPPSQHARIESASLAPPPPHPHPEDIPPGEIDSDIAGPGSLITLSFTPVPILPLRIHWQAQIVDFQWNHHFTDLQLRGPFRSWQHTHTFTPETRAHDSRVIDGTTVHDTVQYEPPFGLLGDLAHRLFLARQFQSTFNYRHARAAELIASA
jgi:ligand-binding SRPBCC domain-containing protein